MDMGQIKSIKIANSLYKQYQKRDTNKDGVIDIIDNKPLPQTISITDHINNYVSYPLDIKINKNYCLLRYMDVDNNKHISKPEWSLYQAKLKNDPQEAKKIINESFSKIDEEQKLMTYFNIPITKKDIVKTKTLREEKEYADKLLKEIRNHSDQRSIAYTDKVISYSLFKIHSIFNRGAIKIENKDLFYQYEGVDIIKVSYDHEMKDGRLISKENSIKDSDNLFDFNNFEKVLTKENQYFFDLYRVSNKYLFSSSPYTAKKYCEIISVTNNNGELVVEIDTDKAFIVPEEYKNCLSFEANKDGIGGKITVLIRNTPNDKNKLLALSNDKDYISLIDHAYGYKQDLDLGKVFKKLEQYYDKTMIPQNVLEKEIEEADYLKYLVNKERASSYSEVVKLVKKLVNDKQLDLSEAPRFLHSFFNYRFCYLSNDKTRSVLLSPDNFFALNGGVCDDWSWAFVSILKEIGFPQNKMFVFHGRWANATINHMAAAFQDKDGKWYSFQEKGIATERPFDSKETIIDYFSQKMNNFFIENNNASLLENLKNFWQNIFKNNKYNPLVFCDTSGQKIFFQNIIKN